MTATGRSRPYVVVSWAVVTVAVKRLFGQVTHELVVGYRASIVPNCSIVDK